MPRGFSLIEVLVATTLTTVATIGLAQLAVMSARVNHVARSISLASAFASQKMEQLETALTPSPPNALTEDTAGYCDYIDRAGRSLEGPPLPAGAEFVRRWSIESLDANETLLVQVSVTRLDARAGTRRAAGETRIADVRTRRAP